MEHALQNLFNAYEEFSKGEQNRKVNPSVALLASLTIAVVASFSPTVKAASLAIAVALVQSALYGISFGRLAKSAAASSLVAVLVVTPLLLMNLLGIPARQDLIKWRSYAQVAIFALRVSASSLALFSAASYLGWQGLVAALSSLRAPPLLTQSLALMLRYIPLLTRDAFRVLVAREARLVGSSFRLRWLSLSSVVGSLVARSIRRALLLGMAMEARGGPPSPRWQLRLSWYDAFFLAASLLPLLGLWLL